MFRIYLVLIFCFGLITHSTVLASDVYPEWFLYPTNYDNIYVGYSYSGLSALEDAESMYAAYNECVVSGTLEIFEDGKTADLLKNSNYFYYFSPDSVNKIRGRLHPVDYFSVNVITNDYITAFALDSTRELKAPRIDSDEVKQPDWINTPFREDNNYYYGVGMYTSLGNENDAWKTAEEQAIFSILNSLAVEYHKINITRKEYQDDVETVNIEEISFLKIKYLLRNIKILERYPDKKDKLFYVLVSIPKNNVLSPMLK